MVERIKRATSATADYRFVRKPELRHQYGMLFNHHGQVISGLKNIDLFLSIDLPKTEDIAHVPPEFPECDNWAALHKSQKHSMAYYSILGFETDGQGPMSQFNTHTTSRLTFQVLDPDELDQFLNSIRRQLREERSPFELAFNHMYQFYAEPMVMFTNMHDQLLVNVPILLRLTTQKPLNLYSNDMVPKPLDTKTLEGMNNEYTFINNSYPYMALNQHIYIPLTETQLRMCDKMGPTYYCQGSYVLRQRTQHTCESAIYYKMDACTITKHCQAKFAANIEFTPKVLDAGETMVLFNLPRPWILLCGHHKRPTKIEMATYKVVN